MLSVNRAYAKRCALTENAISDIPGRVGRKMQWPEKFLASFAAGTLARLQALLEPGEDQRSVVRKLVEAELKRRERKR